MPLDFRGFDGMLQENRSGCNLDMDQSLVDRLRNDESMDIPWQLTDFDLWSNYVDDDLYELDKKVREYIRKCRYQRESKGGQRTAVPLVFAWIFGRKPTSKDSQVCVKLHMLLKYYCTRYTGKNAIKGRKFNRVYYFSRYAGMHKRPYSLRLRLEEQASERSFVEYGDLDAKGPKPRRGDRGDVHDEDGGRGEDRGGVSS